MTYPNRLSPDSLIAVLDAFSAVYDVRTVPDTRHDPYYLGNLPPECRSAAGIDEAPTSTAVRTAVAETRRGFVSGFLGASPGWLAATFGCSSPRTRCPALRRFTAPFDRTGQGSGGSPWKAMRPCLAKC